MGICLTWLISRRVKHDLCHVASSKAAAEGSFQDAARLAVLQLLCAVALVRAADVRQPLLLLPAPHVPTV